MADLIDRQALLKEICNSCDGWCDNTNCDCVNCKSEHRCDAVCDIANAHTVDAVEVVRCKDCKHYKRGFVFKDTMFCYRPDEGGDTIIRIFKDNDFCSYGERREEDG